MTERRPRSGKLGTRVVAALGGTVLLGAGTVVVASTPADAFLQNSFGGSLLRGSAHGGNGQVANGTDSIVKIGPIAKQSLGCNPKLGTDATTFKEDEDVSSQINYVSSIKVPIPDQGYLLRAQQIRNSGYADASNTQALVGERSTTHYVNVLNGLLTATTLQETAYSTLDASGRNDRAEMVVQDLWIDPDGSGPQQAFEVPPPDRNDKVIDLGPIGYVILNEQTSEPDPNDSSRTIFKANAVHLHLLDANGFHGDVYVAHVETMLAQQPARISGFAYSSKGDVSPFLASGKQAAVNLPCAGTGGKDKVTTQARVLVRGPDGSPDLLDEGTLKNIVNAVLSSTSPYSRSTSKIETASLFKDASGLPRIDADVIETIARTFAGTDRDAYDAAKAKATADGTPVPTRASFAVKGVNSVGTMNLARLVIDGNEIALPVPPNTVIPLPGLGFVVLNEQRCNDSSTGSTGTNPDDPPAAGAPKHCTSIAEDGSDSHYNQITVIGIHVHVNQNNDTGLPIGSDIYVAVAHSDVAF